MIETGCKVEELIPILDGERRIDQLTFSDFNYTLANCAKTELYLNHNGDTDMLAQKSPFFIEEKVKCYVG